MNWFRLILIGFSMVTLWGRSDDMPKEIRTFINQYCLKCHGGEKVKGEVDFSLIQTHADMDAHFELWETVAELLRDREMPPDTSAQPDNASINQVQAWYQLRFVDAVQAHPGYFQPRRLSAAEYRNTLRSLFGFDLKVQIMESEQTVIEPSLVLKLLPTDPPGKSGFTNDTHANPLSTLIWDQYSYLVDQALQSLFSGEQPEALKALSGVSNAADINAAAAENLLRTFLPRAHRRPVDDQDLQTILDRLQQKTDLVATLKTEMKVALMSPAFLYRGIRMPRTPDMRQPVDAYEYAERLSYFLWGDMPDAALFQLAANNQILQKNVQQEQVQRMLQSPKSRYLAEAFAWEWFALADMEQAARQVPVIVAMREQVMNFFHYLMVENRPLTELIDSRVSFVSPLIARYYGKDREQLATYRKQKGIELEIVPTQRIRLEHTKERGGILTMPGILAMNRGPVLRGTWMLHRILGEHLPPPPMNVGQVPPQAPGENLSFRQRFESHRNQASCAVCHDRIDPLGFAAQGFDDNGNYILTETVTSPDGRILHLNKNGEPIDTSGTLPNGTSFDGFDELKHILKTEYRTQIIRNIVERTLSFALCRSLALHDRPTVDSIVDTLEKEDGTYHDLLYMIIQSLPFRETFVKAEPL